MVNIECKNISQIFRFITLFVVDTSAKARSELQLSFLIVGQRIILFFCLFQNLRNFQCFTQFLKCHFTYAALIVIDAAKRRNKDSFFHIFFYSFLYVRRDVLFNDPRTTYFFRLYKVEFQNIISRTSSALISRINGIDTNCAPARQCSLQCERFRARSRVRRLAAFDL